MTTRVKPIPDGYRSLTPYLYVHDGAGALDFYKRAFGAEEVMRFSRPDGKIAHAEMRIGGSVFMLADEVPAIGAPSPRSLGGATSGPLLYVADVDKAVPRAVEAGATLKRPIADQFYGDRTATVEDPFGHSWTIATHKEDVPPEELSRRAEAAGM